MKMKSPAIANFLAGISASAGINFLTVIPTTDDGVVKLKLLVSALPWLPLAFVLVKLATVLDRAQRRADFLTSSELSPEENVEIEVSEFRKASVQVSSLERQALIVSLGCIALVCILFWKGSIANGSVIPAPQSFFKPIPAAATVIRPATTDSLSAASKR